MAHLANTLTPPYPAVICETDRLVIRHFTLTDVNFIVELLNQAAFIQYIGDKAVRTSDDATKYLNEGPLLSYRENGFGLNMVLLKASHMPIGMCGLLKRKELDYPDLGYAFLHTYSGNGYATEAAKSVLSQHMRSYSLEKVLAVTLPNNQSSIKVLSKLGFHLKNTVQLYGAQNNVYEYRA